MMIPVLSEAQAYLRKAETLNPGPWVSHSVRVAEAARAIADLYPRLDGETAYTLGLLHDIGRREGVTGMRHVLDGYLYLLNEGYPEAARICLTHSFPVQNVYAGSATWDCTDEELQVVKDSLARVEYDDYDRLFQLCDSVAVPDGFCLVEKRWVDVLIRYQNFNEFTIPKWQAIFDIQRDFESVIGRNIYSLLPGVKETTFGF